MKILVREDDKKLAGLLRKGLETQGFTVDFCEHGDDLALSASTDSGDWTQFVATVPLAPSHVSP